MPLKKLRTEIDRLNALRSYNILDTIEEADYDELTQLASVICQMPISLISLVDEKRQWFKSHTGLSAKQTPIEQSFCAHAIASTADMMVVGDATADERFRSNPLVTGDPNIVFYAGVPLINEDGFSLGTLCVIDSKRHELTQDQKTALRTIAKQVVGKMELRRKNELLRNNEIVLKGLNEELTVANRELHTYQQNLNDLVLRVTQSESRSRAIIADAPVAIGVLTGRDMVIESANEMILEIWGKSRAVVGLPLADALPELREQPFLGLLDNVFTTGKAHYGTNAKVELERGGILMENFYNFVYQPIKDVSGQTSSIMVVANDVTEQVNASKIIEES
ncbi:MAG: GAF domain-containing protein, partial [Pedobacter sp.]